MSDNIPTTEEVRRNYQYGKSNCGCCMGEFEEDAAEFDRWLEETINEKELAEGILENNEWQVLEIQLRALGQNPESWRKLVLNLASAGVYPFELMFLADLAAGRGGARPQ